MIQIIKMKKILTFTILGLFFISCSKDNPVTSASYQGNWRITFAGSYSGGGLFTIKNDGSFSDNIILVSPQGDSSRNVFTGTISSNGALQDGKIFFGGNQVGSVTGLFTLNSASGMWSLPPNLSSSTWTANRQ